MTPEFSIILPCRNEEKALSYCLNSLKKVIQKNNLSAEIIVSDSSTDTSPNIAKKHAVILVKHNKEGYGNAYLEGFKVAKGKYIIMADADGTYDFKEIPKFIKQIKHYDFVIGNRFSGNMQKDSMPKLHKYIGNPLLSFLMRFFFKTKIKDSHCGMRAIRKDKLEQLNLNTTGMEFASEMIIKALRHKLTIKEVPISYSKRIGSSKLSSFKDGWKHLRFMLIYSPTFLFFIPGLILFLLGIFFMSWFYVGFPVLFGTPLYYHPLFFASIAIITGYQLIMFTIFSKTYSMTHLRDQNNFLNKIYELLTIDKAILTGLVILFVGILIYLGIFLKWVNSGFSGINEIKNLILALTVSTVGIQTIFSSFMISILGIKEK